MNDLSGHDRLLISGMSNLEIENKLEEIDLAIWGFRVGQDVIGDSVKAMAVLDEAEQRGYEVSPEVRMAAEAPGLADWELIHNAAKESSRGDARIEWRWVRTYGPEISRRWTYEAACEAIEAERRKGYICEDASAPPEEWWIKPPNPEVDRKCL